MPNLQEIRRRIASVKSTQKITRAMKMVAAAKLRRAQEAVVKVRPYAIHMHALTNELLKQVDVEEHPLLTPGKSPKVGLIVVSSDRGLCGGFNAGVVSTTMNAVKTQFAGRPVELIIVGRKGLETLRRRGFKIHASYTGVFDRLSPNSGVRVIEDAVGDFTGGAFGEVYCLYSDFSSSLSQHIRVDRLLPYVLPEVEGPPANYLLEPSGPEILYELLVENIQVQFHRILHESVASEYAARMRAMDSATKNAGDVIDRLTLRYNRVRQDAITREVVEVIGAAEAL